VPRFILLSFTAFRKILFLLAALGCVANVLFFRSAFGGTKIASDLQPQSSLAVVFIAEI
jgi:hypothetical protein